jgi:hypothetical protein
MSEGNGSGPSDIMPKAPRGIPLLCQKRQLVSCYSAKGKGADMYPAILQIAPISIPLLCR